MNPAEIILFIIIQIIFMIILYLLIWDKFLQENKYDVSQIKHEMRMAKITTDHLERMAEMNERHVDTRYDILNSQCERIRLRIENLSPERVDDIILEFKKMIMNLKAMGEDELRKTNTYAETIFRVMNKLEEEYEK